jgi:hypothetical protein
MSSSMPLHFIADPMLYQHHTLVLSFNYLRCHIFHYIHALHLRLLLLHALFDN